MVICSVWVSFCLFSVQNDIIDLIVSYILALYMFPLSSPFSHHQKTQICNGWWALNPCSSGAGVLWVCFLSCPPIPWPHEWLSYVCFLVRLSGLWVVSRKSAWLLHGIHHESTEGVTTYSCIPTGTSYFLHSAQTLILAFPEKLETNSSTTLFLTRKEKLVKIKKRKLFKWPNWFSVLSFGFLLSITTPSAWPPPRSWKHFRHFSADNWRQRQNFICCRIHYPHWWLHGTILTGYADLHPMAGCQLTLFQDRAACHITESRWHWRFSRDF